MNMQKLRNLMYPVADIMKNLAINGLQRMLLKAMNTIRFVCHGRLEIHGNSLPVFYRVG